MNETRPPPRPPEGKDKSPEKQPVLPITAEQKISLNSSISKPTPKHSNTSMDRRVEYAMRSRADSVESTRGALFGSSATKISPKKRTDQKEHMITPTTFSKTASRPHNMPVGSIGNQPSENRDSSGYSSRYMNIYDTTTIPNDLFVRSGYKQDHHAQEVLLEPTDQNIRKDREGLHSPLHLNRDQDEYDIHSETGESRFSLIGDSLQGQKTVQTWREWLEDIVYTIFWDPKHDPEFSTLQQNTWAILLGILMGVFTAKWGDVIEYCVDFVWVVVPEKLLEWGFFCYDLHDCRALPLPHYMWMCPTIFGGVSPCRFLLCPFLYRFT